MKKLVLIATALVVSAFASEAQEFEGLLTTPGCAAQGAFNDCYLENYTCGSDGCYKKINAGETTNPKLALFQHATGKVYEIDVSKLKISELGEGMNKNGVIINGILDEATNTIAATEFKAPPPPKKSFFKGCL
jgi:hypothetical protein